MQHSFFFFNLHFHSTSTMEIYPSIIYFHAWQYFLENLIILLCHKIMYINLNLLTLEKCPVTHEVLRVIFFPPGLRHCCYYFYYK